MGRTGRMGDGGYLFSRKMMLGLHIKRYIVACPFSASLVVRDETLPI